MDDSDSSADEEPFPLICEVCDELCVDIDETAWSVIEQGEEMQEDDWYLHVHELKGEEIEDCITEDNLYLFCPDCSPDTALPTADEDDDFDMDEYIADRKN